MKKLLLLTLVAVFVFSGMSFAAQTKYTYSFGGAFNTASILGMTSFTAQPILVVNIDNKYDVVAGYQSIPTSDDPQTSILLGGTMWMFKNGAINCGWSAYYLSVAFADSADENTLSSISIAFTAKTPLVAGVDLRADAILLSSISGKVADDSQSGSAISPYIQLSILFNFM